MINPREPDIGREVYFRTAAAPDQPRRGVVTGVDDQHVHVLYQDADEPEPVNRGDLQWVPWEERTAAKEADDA